MYVKVTNGVVEKYPYSIGDLRKDNSNTSFPANPSNEIQAEWGVYPVIDTPEPATTLLLSVLSGVRLFLQMGSGRIPGTRLYYLAKNNKTFGKQKKMTQETNAIAC